MKNRLCNTLLLMVVASALARLGLQRQVTLEATDCSANLKQISWGLDMYNTDNAGYYPESLEKLPAAYLPFIPSCPSRDQSAYSCEIQNLGYPKRYTIQCPADHPARNGTPALTRCGNSEPACDR